jgi:hypothetical protein
MHFAGQLLSGSHFFMANVPHLETTLAQLAGDRPARVNLPNYLLAHNFQALRPTLLAC